MGTLLFANTVGAIVGPLLLGPSTKAATYYGLNPYMGPWLFSGLFGLAAAAAIFFFLYPEPNSLREKPAAKPSASASAAAPAPVVKKAKLSYKEQRELEALPGRIEALEAEQKTLADLLAGTEIYADAKKLATTQSRYAALDAELLAAMERWETLGSR
jgi:hypothetical protein